MCAVQWSSVIRSPETLNPHYLSIQVLRELLIILFPGVHLEVHNISTVLGHLFMIADINLLSTLTNQTHIVWNHENAPFKLIQTPRKGIDRLHIKRVRRFVQQESNKRIRNKAYWNRVDASETLTSAVVRARWWQIRFDPSARRLVAPWPAVVGHRCTHTYRAGVWFSRWVPRA